MRFFHLSDLHIGKQLHHYNLKEDQEHILQEVVQYARELKPDAIVIAGDIYNKSVPSAEAVEVFDTFLTELSELNIPLLLIAGNHDSAQRLDYAKAILGRQHIFIAGKAPETADEHIRKVTLVDAYGEIDFWLLPFLKPGYVRSVFADTHISGTSEEPFGIPNPQAGNHVQSEEHQQLSEEHQRPPESYQEAVERLLEREHIDWTRRNVLVSHQFYTGADGEMLTCDSENVQVGGLDRIDSRGVGKFDYVALGHLHGAQCAGQEHVRYCGTLLKYSVSESEQEKALHVINIKAKGEPVEVIKYPLYPLRDVRKVRGRLADILENAKAETLEDYISITLTDEVEPYKPKEQLERVFSHILEIRMDNTRTRRKLCESGEEVKLQDPLTLFGEFYREVQGRELTEEERDVLRNCYSSAVDECMD